MCDMPREGVAAISRRRYISSEISTDKIMRKLSDSEALFYTWMIPHVNDDATITSDPDELAAIVVPNRKNWSTEKVASTLGVLERFELLTCQNGTLFVPPGAFYRYQTNVPTDKRRTSHPQKTPANEATAKNSENQHKTAQNSASLSLSPSPSKHMSKSNALDFDQFWDLYPRREGKGKARESFAKAAKKKPAPEIVAALRERLPALRAKERQYIPLPATWLNQERWDDEVVTGPGPAYRPYDAAAAEDELRQREALADFGGEG